MQNSTLPTKKSLNWLWIVAGVLVVVIIALTIYLLTGNDDTTNNNTSSTYNNTPQNTITTTNTTSNTSTNSTTEVSWSFNGQEWAASGTPPACDEPVTLATPVDLTKVSSILYPGQTRGGNYKPHGGFRFSTADNNVRITAPLDAVATEGSRYIEQGEVQYLIFFVNPCGIAYRFDHLKTLSPAMQSLMETLPEPEVDNSRTTRFDNPVKVKKGDLIATAVGFKKNNNVSVDLGVYDLRQANEASQSASYASKYGQFASQTFYAVCWLDLLPSADKATVRSLPGTDATAGKTSDYCQ